MSRPAEVDVRIGGARVVLDPRDLVPPWSTSAQMEEDLGAAVRAAVAAYRANDRPTGGPA